MHVCIIYDSYQYQNNKYNYGLLNIRDLNSLTYFLSFLIWYEKRKVKVGGKKILFYELSSASDQATRRGKKRRLEKRKTSLMESEVEKSKEKEKERESRKLKPTCYVAWPWSEVTS